MYICICNALCERDVRRAIRDGAGRPRDVYAGCGCNAQCGCCTATILDLIRSDVAPSPHAHAIQR